MENKIGILNYDSSNLISLSKCLETLKFRYIIPKNVKRDAHRFTMNISIHPSFLSKSFIYQLDLPFFSLLNPPPPPLYPHIVLTVHAFFSLFFSIFIFIFIPIIFGLVFGLKTINFKKPL